ncbi:LOW QUALITY PROTEIN: cob(I)alamin adenosyltransferase PduO [Geomicrobium sp. JCM 19037]|nr:LOW QUALITY PROTEIN: cob(I)alamin adenosyltransferase PduO [Geomicrobium sp. JCM 19037]
MRIYTRGGDEGKTSVIGGRRKKHDQRIVAYGSIDEVNSFVAKARHSVAKKRELHKLESELLVIQHELFDCGSDLATVKPDPTYKVTERNAAQLEEWIDHWTSLSPEIERFILPGGSEASADLHVCRTETRRAEREVAALAEIETIHMPVLAYMNRLSDYFFTVARFVNHSLDVADIPYERSAIVFKD